MATATKLTYQDYLLFPEGGLRHELLDGDHAVTPAPTPHHQRIVNRLAFLLTGHVEKTGAGEVFTAPIDVHLSEADVVQPEVLFLATERLAEVTDVAIAAAPDLVAEILSPATRQRDETLKRKLYERHGVAEYWLVDPAAGEVRVLRSVDGRFRKAGRFGPGETLESQLFPGLRIAIDELL